MGIRLEPRELAKPAQGELASATLSLLNLLCVQDAAVLELVMVSFMDLTSRAYGPRVWILLRLMQDHLSEGFMALEFYREQLTRSSFLPSSLLCKQLPTPSFVPLVAQQELNAILLKASGLLHSSVAPRSYSLAVWFPLPLATHYPQP